MTYKLVTSEGDDENYAFWNINCKSIGMDELGNMNSEIKSVMTQANVAVLANIAAITLVATQFPAIKKEIESLDMLGKAAGLASLAQATAFQIRLLNDNADKIRTFAKASKPFRSSFGLPGSA